MPIEANRCGNRPFILCMASCGGRGGLGGQRWGTREAHGGAHGRALGRWVAAAAGACLEAVVPEARGLEDNVVGLWRGQEGCCRLAEESTAPRRVDNQRAAGVGLADLRGARGGGWGSSGRD
jgi:hypothetical protein